MNQEAAERNGANGSNRTNATAVVYVDSLMPCLRNRNWRHDEACHLFVPVETGVDVLHAFAERMGLKRCWFQNKRGSMPHCDLTRGKRFQALKLGAVEASREVTVATMKEWRGASASAPASGGPAARSSR